MRIHKIKLLICLIVLTGCVADKGKIDISFTKKNSQSVSLANISSVQVINNQLVITGTGLNGISIVKVTGNSLNQNFTIESKSSSQIIANAMNAFSFDVSKVFSLMISDAQGSATFPIDFSLCNSTLNGKGFNCLAPVSDKDVLSYDAVSGTWKPRPATGLNYLGTFDASSNPGTGPAIGASGAYYIISDDGTIGAVPFAVGDWLVSNGTTWQKIDNSTAVLSVFNRTGAVVAQEGDYSLNLLSDVSLPGTPATGKVLKFDGTNWVASDDLTGGGAGSVTTTSIAAGAVTDAKIDTVSASKITGTITSAQIADGTIVNADINAAAAIDYSKLNIPNTSIPYAKLNIANGDIPAAKISGLPAVTSVLATMITDNDTTHAPDGNAVFDALGLKLNLTGGALTGGGTISNVPNPVAPTDASNRQYTDTKLALAGGTMTGDLNLETDLNLKGTTNYVTLKAGGATAAYTLTLPLNAGTNGQVLTTNGANPAVLTWTTPSAGGGSGTVTSVTGSGPISVTNTTTTPAITIATANTTTTGVLSSADWNTFNSKASNTLADGSIFIGNSSNVATATAVTGDVTITNAGVTTIGANKVVDSHIAANTISPAKLSGARAATDYLKGNNTWSDLVADVRAVTLGTVTPTSGAPYSPVSTGDTLAVAFNKTQGQLNYVAANAVTKDGTNFLTGSTAVQGMTARLTVPTPIITDLNDATNVQYVSTAITNALATLPWETGSGNVYRSTGNVGIQTSSPNTALDINGALSMRGMAAPALSPAGQGRIYFDSTSKRFLSSLDGAAYSDMATPAFPMQGSAGTAALPTYSFSTDTDTGIYSNGSNQLAFATGGTQRFRIQDKSFYLGDLGSSGSNPSSFSFDSRHYGSGGIYTIGKFNITTSYTLTSAGGITSPGLSSTTSTGGTYNISGLMGGASFSFYNGSSGTYTGDGYGARGLITTSSGYGNTSGELSGLIGGVEFNDGAAMPTLTKVNAVKAHFSLAGTATGGTHIVTAYGVQSSIAAGLNDLIDTWVGVYVKAPIGAGTVTTKYAMTTEPGSGNVGIGVIAPVSTLDVNGAIKSTAVTNSSTTIDFSTGNLQYTSSDCAAMILNNLKSGGTYTLAVQGTTGGTCSFTAYSGVATGALTVKTGPASLVQSANKHAIYTFMVMGSFVYVASIDGY